MNMRRKRTLTQQRALDGIVSWTLSELLCLVMGGEPPEQVITPRKRSAALDIQRLISPSLLKSSTVVYVGSGYDILFPIACGGRNILLLDPSFAEKETRAMLSILCSEFSGKKCEEQDSSDQQSVKLHLRCSFDGPPEDVCVHVDARMYPQENRKTVWPEGMHPEALTDFPQIGLLIAFNSGLVRLEDYPEIVNSIAHGGYVLTDHPSAFAAEVKAGIFEKCLLSSLHKKEYSFLQKK